MTTNDYLLKAFQSLGEVIEHKDNEIRLLKYRIEELLKKEKEGKKYENI